MMYNEELKSRFIKECCEDKSATNRAHRLFEAAEGFENNWGNDICTMPEDVLGEALQEITSARLGTQLADMSILKKYARWCLDNQVPSACEGLLKNHEVGCDKLRTTMVDSPEQLQSYMDKAFPSINDCRVDNLCRGLYWLAYMGFEEKEAAEVRVEHVDLKNASIHFGGKLYPIYREAIPTIRYLCSANSFIYDYKKYEAVIERDSGTQLLRGMRSGSGVNTDSIGRLAARRLASISANPDEKIVLRYKSLRLSGIFYKMLDDERRTGDVNFGEYLKMYFSNTDQLAPKRRGRKEVELATDYQRWKAAFNK